MIFIKKIKIMEFDENGEHSNTQQMLEEARNIIKNTHVKNEGRRVIRREDQPLKFTLCFKTIAGPVEIKRYKSLVDMAKDVGFQRDQVYKLRKGFGRHKDQFEILDWQGYEIFDE